MIYSLKGIFLKAESNFLVIECAGVGYKCLTSFYTQSKLKDKIGDEIIVYTYLNVRQDAVDLFGFVDEQELECFKSLTSVSGIGPKAALAILSQYSADQVVSMVISGDSKSLTAAPGIGAKTAQRIVLELKDKLSKIIDSERYSNHDGGFVASSSNHSEAIKALSALGYSAQDVTPVVSSLDPSTSVEELITLALKSMMKKGR